MFHRRSRTGACIRRFQSSHRERGVWCALSAFILLFLQISGNRPVRLAEEGRPVGYRPEEAADVDEVKGAFAICPLALRIVYLEANVWGNPVRKRLSEPLYTRKLSRTIRVVLERGLSCSVSRVCLTGVFGPLPVPMTWLVLSC